MMKQMDDIFLLSIYFLATYQPFVSPLYSPTDCNWSYYRIDGLITPICISAKYCGKETLGTDFILSEDTMFQMFHIIWFKLCIT